MSFDASLHPLLRRGVRVAPSAIDSPTDSLLGPDAEARILAVLTTLVACDTRNPPRDAPGIDQLFAAVRVAAPADVVVEERDLGEGCRWLMLHRGDVDAVPWVNVHIDTVPRDDGWQQDPFTLTVDTVDGERRATGLGACDIKGAVAAFLVACADVQGPFCLLLTSDEEAGSSRCVRTFVEAYDVVGRLMLVAEPTQGRAVVAHRGIATAVVEFTGTPGHASLARAVDDSAVSEAVRFCAAAHDLAAADDQAIRLNLGRLEGGTKANMIASSATLRFGVRPPPEQPPPSVLAKLAGLLRPGRGTLTPGFVAPALPSARQGGTVVDARRAACVRARALGLDVGDDVRDEVREEVRHEGGGDDAGENDLGIMVDFFTEAAFFSAAGADAVVFGPGDIAQAHTAGEWVRVSELVDVAQHYARLIATAPPAGARVDGPTRPLPEAP